MATVTIPLHQPIVPVPAFNQTIHEEVSTFLGTLTAEYLTSDKFTHMKTHSNTVRLICAIAASACSFAAGFAYKTAHKSAAIGLGIGAVVILVAGIVKGVRVTKEFAAFSKSCNQATEHFRGAYLSKATFMIDRNEQDFNLWNATTDQNLSELYNEKSPLSNDVLQSLAEDQRPWQRVHYGLCGAASRLNPQPFANVKNPEVKDLLMSLAKAREVLLYGQSPLSTVQEEKTYV